MACYRKGGCGPYEMYSCSQCPYSKPQDDNREEKVSKVKNAKKLFKVTLKGMTHSSTGMIHGMAYVIADGMDEAYQKLREHLDSKDLGFSKDRELDKIELLAEDHDYSDTNYRLFL